MNISQLNAMTLPKALKPTIENLNILRHILQITKQSSKDTQAFKEINYIKLSPETYVRYGARLSHSFLGSGIFG